jgi:hypothetical protein
MCLQGSSGSPDYVNHYANGQMADLRVYDDILNAADVLSLIQTGGTVTRCFPRLREGLALQAHVFGLLSYAEH